MSNQWSKYLPLVQRIINSSINSSTGVTPAEIVFPNGLTLDRTLVSETNPIYLSSYIKELQRAQAMIIKICEKNLRKKDQAHIDQYSKERTIFPKGSYVLAEHRHNSLRRGPKSKLLPFLRGPMLVKSHTADGMYILQDIVTQRLAEYHVSRLRKFEHNEQTDSPLKVAVTDFPGEFIVQECLDMQGDPRKHGRKQLRFKIRWAGYGPEDDTWEPWDCVRDSDAVQKYLHNHPNKRIRKLVKPGYTPPEKRTELEMESDNSEDEMSTA